jgi:hypothetical protein
MGPGDHACHEGQARIATKKARDKYDYVWVTEKLDGSCVAVARLDNALIPLGRAGYTAMSSPFQQHVAFAHFVNFNQDRFLEVLEDGERLVGEWLLQAHGTTYFLPHEPFVAFDLMRGHDRVDFMTFLERNKDRFITPSLLGVGPMSVEDALEQLQRNMTGYGFHGATEPVEGAVWRVERDRLVDKRLGGERRREVDFLVKYVRPDKVDGKYLESVSGEGPVWNTWSD